VYDKIIKILTTFAINIVLGDARYAKMIPMNLPNEKKP